MAGNTIPSARTGDRKRKNTLTRPDTGAEVQNSAVGRGAGEPVTQTGAMSGSAGNRPAPMKAAQPQNGVSQGYEPGQGVRDAAQAVQRAEAERPGSYSSHYADAEQGLLDAVLHRPEFSYDPERDPLYGQYREQYMRQGARAMEDTMGQAAGLTGGYGSTYSQMAGQAAYSGYLDALNDMLPKLYEQALDQYEREGQAMLEKLGLTQRLEERDYDRWSEDYDRWFRAYTDAQDRYETAGKLDFDRFLDLLNYWQREAAAQQGQENWQAEYDLDWERFLWQKLMAERGGAK